VNMTHAPGSFSLGELLVLSGKIVRMA
jgi:hypothetical protein